MRVTLEQVCDKASSNIAQKDIVGLDGDFPIYGAAGLIGSVDFYQQDKPYVAVVKDGAGVGRVMNLPAKSSVIGTMQYLIHRDNILNDYLYYALKYMHLEKHYNGAAIPHIYFKDYKKEEFNLVSIPEQQVIVNNLKRIETILDKKKEQITNLDLLIKSRFVELFRQFKAEKTIGELTNICRGASPRPIQSFITKDDNGENWIKIGDVGENDIYITEAAEKVTKAGADKSRRVKPGDFILSNSMSFGRPYILAIDGCVHDGWLIISDYEETFEQLFFYYLLRSDDVQLQFNGSVAGAVVKNLNSDLVRKVKVITPPLSLQKEFVEFAKQIDKSKFRIIQYTFCVNS